jgi:hypothetical protein
MKWQEQKSPALQLLEVQQEVQQLEEQQLEEQQLEEQQLEEQQQLVALR